MKKQCECCGGENQWELKSAYNDGEKTYNVCSCCLIELTTYNLTPIHFKNLIKAGHDPEEFLLHGDFYDDNGMALQPAYE